MTSPCIAGLLETDTSMPPHDIDGDATVAPCTEASIPLISSRSSTNTIERPSPSGASTAAGEPGSGDVRSAGTTVASEESSPRPDIHYRYGVFHPLLREQKTACGMWLPRSYQTTCLEDVTCAACWLAGRL